jgi:hypothetical protein
MAGDVVQRTGNLLISSSVSKVNITNYDGSKYIINYLVVAL